MQGLKKICLLVAMLSLVASNSVAGLASPNSGGALPEPSVILQAQPTLNYEKYKLKNGLDVILLEDHRLPMVAVNLWYHVGPSNERPGLTGFAHLFEHMMFQGSSSCWKARVPPTSTARPISTAQTISRRCLQTSLSWPCGSNQTAWDFCSTLLTSASLRTSAT
jgi:hypothetical protein